MNAVGRVTSWLAGASDATRYGLVALAALLGADQLLRLSDVVAAKSAERAAIREALGAAQTTVSEETWAARGRDAARALERYDGRVWRATSYGVAAAEIRASIDRAANALAAPNTAIEVDPTPLEGDFGEALRFNVRGRTRDGAVWTELTASIIVARPAFIVDELTLSYLPNGEVNYELSGLAVVDIASTDEEAGA